MSSLSFFQVIIIFSIPDNNPRQSMFPLVKQEFKMARNPNAPIVWKIPKARLNVYERNFASIDKTVRREKTEIPIHCLRPLLTQL